MGLFGRKRDISLFNAVNRELLREIVNQEILFYKISLESTSTNIYGESKEKFFDGVPSRLVCLVTRGDQQFNDEDFGPDLARDVSFAFLREDLRECKLVPEVGDFIKWHNDFYEVDVVRENQLVLGKDANYDLADNLLGQFGASISIICDSHITRESRVKLVDGAVLPRPTPELTITESYKNIAYDATGSEFTFGLKVGEEDIVDGEPTIVVSPFYPTGSIPSEVTFGEVVYRDPTWVLPFSVVPNENDKKVAKFNVAFIADGLSDKKDITIIQQKQPPNLEVPTDSFSASGDVGTIIIPIELTNADANDIKLLGLPQGFSIGAITDTSVTINVPKNILTEERVIIINIELVKDDTTIKKEVTITQEIASDTQYIKVLEGLSDIIFQGATIEIRLELVNLKSDEISIISDSGWLTFGELVLDSGDVYTLNVMVLENLNTFRRSGTITLIYGINQETTITINQDRNRDITINTDMPARFYRYDIEEKERLREIKSLNSPKHRRNIVEVASDNNINFSSSLSEGYGVTRESIFFSSDSNIFSLSLGYNEPQLQHAGFVVSKPVGVVSEYKAIFPFNFYKTFEPEVQIGNGMFENIGTVVLSNDQQEFKVRINYARGTNEGREMRRDIRTYLDPYRNLNNGWLRELPGSGTPTARDGSDEYVEFSYRVTELVTDEDSSERGDRSFLMSYFFHYTDGGKQYFTVPIVQRASKILYHTII